ncbi:MAG: Beta-galactosidase [Paenibacillus sp.]|nr:Beta-galactosidase [Paenibacillus sp.]
MNYEIQAEEAVRFDTDGIRIHGKPEMLLCASLFYFRIPRAYWKERMEQLAAFGYNAIDVYFPWNYHERSEGSWDFGGERDVAAFLEAARDSGLWVVARPGPYICSEWDGGALPAYLLAGEEQKLRDNDPAFLTAVARWFDVILPIIASYQAGNGGTVVAMQLDNELDFYGCSDPKGYMEALRDMALKRGITVPLFACAGQGGILQASGLAEGVMPTCNFYPNDRDPSFEEKVLGYGELLGSMGYPLLVTETNRSHYLLRRLLSCGAKLLGPYLQVSGTDFGFTNATNNWGKPLAFMTSDYDFHGMISPEGHIREEAYEGRLLRRLMEAYGPALAEAKTSEGDCRINGETEGIAGPFALALHGGGSLVFIANLDDRAKRINLVDDESETAAAGFALAGGRALALPANVPLNRWGMEGMLLSSTSELYRTERLPSGHSVLCFHTEGAGKIRLRTAASVTAHCEHGELARDGELIAFQFEEGVAARLALRSESGQELILIVHAREQALLSEEPDERGYPIIRQMPRYASEEQPAAGQWRLGAPDRETPSSYVAVRPSTGIRNGERDRLEPLEAMGVYRGFAWYEGNVGLPAGTSAHGLLARQAGDVVSLYWGGRYVGTAAPGGGSRYLALDGAIASSSGSAENRIPLRARVEIWGHSNFDDIRLPGLRLNSRKGLGGTAVITRIAALSGNWRAYRGADRIIPPQLVSVGADRSLWPVVNFGGWLSPDHPAFELYSRTFDASASADSWTLRFEGLQARAKLFVGGEEVCDVNPFDPFVDITPYVTPGEIVELTVFLERALGLPAGEVKLYEGVEASGWSVSAAEEPELLLHAEEASRNAASVQLPVELKPGEVAWLFGDAINSAGGKGWRALFDGSGLKLTVFLEGTIVSRMWLPGGEERPVLTGGSQHSAYLPGAWFGEGKARLAIMLEAVDPTSNGRLNAVTFRPVQQLE